MCHNTKFHSDRSNHCRDMTIFGFFKMAAIVILDFYIFETLTVGTIKGVKLRQSTKFHGDRSNQMAAKIWGFFKMVAAAILHF